jgi:hypothetical protein
MPDDRVGNVYQAFLKRFRLTSGSAIIITIVINCVKILSKSMLIYRYSTFSIERCQNLNRANNEFNYKIL